MSVLRHPTYGERGIRHERANKWHKLRLVDDDPVITQAEALDHLVSRLSQKRPQKNAENVMGLFAIPAKKELNSPKKRFSSN